MDAVERARYKTLANDAVIATFGEESLTAKLATALETCVSYLGYHGDCNGPEPEGAILNLDTVQAIHEQLKERQLELEKVMTAADEMVDLLREMMKDLKHDLKELGDEL